MTTIASDRALGELSVFKMLTDDERVLVAARCEHVSYPFGSIIVREGEPADALFVLISGRARIIKHADGQEVSLDLLRAGDSFGETALLERTTRTATVRASSALEVLRLDRTTFEELLDTHPSLRRNFELQAKFRHLQNFFRLYTPFAALSRESLERLLQDLEPITVAAGTRVIQEGAEPGPMYIVQDGQLRVFRTEAGRRRYVAYLRRGDVFGEMSVFAGTPRAASVEAVSPVTLLALGRKTFEHLLAEQPEFKQQIADRVAQYDFKHVARVPLDFDEESLPASTSAWPIVSEDQVDAPAAPARPQDVQTLGGVTAETAMPARASKAVDGVSGPFASEDGYFIKRGKRIRRVPLLRQIDEMDCAAASLGMVCRHFGRKVSLVRIRALAHTSLDGTSLRGICRAAQELGLAARSVKTTVAHVMDMPLPAIIHWDNYHWVVLYDVDETHARLADPATGYRTVTRAELETKWSGYAALFDYTDAFEDTPQEQRGAAWLTPFFRPYTGIFVRAIALAAVASALQMAMPVLTQVIVDRVLVDRDVALLHMVIAALVAVVFFMGAASVLQRYLLSFAAVRLDSSTLDYLTRRLLELPMSYFGTRRTGDIQRRLAGMRQVREFIVQNGVVALTSIVQLVTTLVLMFVYSPMLSGVFLLTAPLYVGLMRFSSRVLRPLFDELEQSYGRYSSYQIDAIKGIETVKALGAEGAFRELMLDQFNRLGRRRFRADFTIMTYESVLQLVTLLSIILFLWAGANQVMAGNLTIGALVAFNALVALANAPIITLLTVWDRLQMTTVLLARLDDVFEQEPEQGHDRSKLLPVRTLEGQISLRKLGFRYGGPESPPILQDISIDIAPNTTVAIIGRSGSGKTTLVKLLAGLLEPTEGSILYDRVDMRALNHRDLRRRIGFVLQENHLFSDTIARNIAFGEEEPDLDAVMWASRAASAHEFIERLPLGYDTPVGESGLAISGGQRQRIAIARALYQRPPILIFDEATSALDTESERAVKENIDQLLEGRTSFVIAHRLSTVRDADLILVLERGRLVEQGSHDELMERQGLYFYLCSQQLGS
jgi:ATP-binding cassette subfamily B protein